MPSLASCCLRMRSSTCRSTSTTSLDGPLTASSPRLRGAAFPDTVRCASCELLFVPHTRFPLPSISFAIVERHACPHAVLVLGKAEGQGENWHGHVTAVTVAPEYRRLGLAQQLMNYLELITDKVYANYYYYIIIFLFCALARSRSRWVRRRRTGGMSPFLIPHGGAFHVLIYPLRSFPSCPPGSSPPLPAGTRGTSSTCTCVPPTRSQSVSH